MGWNASSAFSCLGDPGWISAAAQPWLITTTTGPQPLPPAPCQVGRLWTSLADYFIRRGMFERARDVYEEGLTSVITVRDFSLVYDALTQASTHGASARGFRDAVRACCLPLGAWDRLAWALSAVAGWGTGSAESRRRRAGLSVRGACPVRPAVAVPKPRAAAPLCSLRSHSSPPRWSRQQRRRSRPRTKAATARTFSSQTPATTWTCGARHPRPRPRIYLPKRVRGPAAKGATLRSGSGALLGSRPTLRRPLAPPYHPQSVPAVDALLSVDGRPCPPLPRLLLQPLPPG